MKWFNPGVYDYGYYELILLPNKCLPSWNTFTNWLFSVTGFCAFSLSRRRIFSECFRLIFLLCISAAILATTCVSNFSFDVIFLIFLLSSLLSFLFLLFIANLSSIFLAIAYTASITLHVSLFPSKHFCSILFALSRSTFCIRLFIFIKHCPSSISSLVVVVSFFKVSFT